MYLRFFYLFLFLRKRGVLKCKGILREYSASGTAVLGSNSAEMTTVGGGEGLQAILLEQQQCAVS